MNYNPIPLNVGLIDSLTIYLPLDKVKILDYRLVEEFKIIYESTGEVIDELNPPKSMMIKDNGINFRISKVVFPPINNEVPQELIRLTLTSKMLFERYFEGINISNIMSIVEYINTREILHFDTETALDSLTNDIDICINYYLLFEPYKQSLYHLKQMVKLSKQHEVFVFPRKESFQNEFNYGIQFGEREKGSIGSPFCKFYNKTEELLTNSAEFYNRYLFPQIKYGLNINNIIRKEITIKNSAVKQNLRKKKLVSDDNEMKTLRDILSITSEQLTKICNVQLRYYYEKKEFHVKNDLSPTDKIISYYMFKLVTLGQDKLSLQEPLNLFSDPKEKVQKARSKKHLLRLIDSTFDTEYLSQKLAQNSHANEFIRMLELW